MEMKSAPALLEDAVAAVPDRVWFEEVGGGSLTFAEAARESARWSDALRRLGVGDGDRVVTMLPSGTDSVLAWFGLAYLRAVDTGCNAAYLGDMLSYIITNSRAAVMIVSERYAGRLAGIGTGGLKTVVVPDASGLLDLPGLPPVVPVLHLPEPAAPRPVRRPGRVQRLAVLGRHPPLPGHRDRAHRDHGEFPGPAARPGRRR